MIDTDEKLRVLHSLAYGHVDWLDKVSRRKISRPQHEVDRMRQELAVIKAIAGDYEGRQ